MEQNIQYDQKYYDYSLQLAQQKEDMEVRCGTIGQGSIPSTA